MPLLLGCVHSATPSRCCFFLSSFDIPTLRPWSVLFDPFIQAGHSWTLEGVDRLLPSGMDSVKENESLLPCLRGLGLNLSQCHTRTLLEFGNKLNANLIIWAKMLICKSMYRKNNDLPKYRNTTQTRPPRMFWMKTRLKWEIPATWTRKTEALKYGAQFQSITVEIKERIEHRIHQSDLRPNLRPTVIPQTSPKSTSHWKVSHLWNCWW